MKLKAFIATICFLFFLHFDSKAQFEQYVNAEVEYPSYQSGQYNVFGYHLTNIYTQTITVDGYLREDGGTSAPNYYFTITLYPGEEIYSGFVYWLGPASNAEVRITNVTF